MALITRQTDHPNFTNKNQPLTNEEIDNNFIELYDFISGAIDERTPNNVQETVVKRDENGGFKASIIETTGLIFNSKIKLDIIEKNITSNIISIFDTWPSNDYLSASYLIQMIQGTNYQFGELRVMHNGSDVYLSEYSVLSNSQIGVSGTQEPIFTGIISNNVLSLNILISNAGVTPVYILMERKLFKR